MDTFTCRICYKVCNGFGHNPAPIVDHLKCCIDCNNTKVIPARLCLYKLGESHYNHIAYLKHKKRIELFTTLYNRNHNVNN